MKAEKLPHFSDIDLQRVSPVSSGSAPTGRAAVILYSSSLSTRYRRSPASGKTARPAWRESGHDRSILFAARYGNFVATPAWPLPGGETRPGTARHGWRLSSTAPGPGFASGMVLLRGRNIMKIIASDLKVVRENCIRKGGRGHVSEIINNLEGRTSSKMPALV